MADLCTNLDEFGQESDRNFVFQEIERFDCSLVGEDSSFAIE